MNSIGKSKKGREGAEGCWQGRPTPAEDTALPGESARHLVDIFGEEMKENQVLKFNIRALLI